ncbi:MAG TPA: alpha/beta fold hydrolase [Candidatus Corynebacterium gallistercoris]|uniref:Alpha/beta fold hydrolase n=1 Tax=Candidatus Corynebacterium gallistercoris TaxID=2838530 RepID=A0A9D1UQE6_9CORY|nr:alpha/beta fold hydrolase [Candidatus Corynebacterium gallistercoris]
MDAFLPKFFKTLFKDNPLPRGVNKWDEPLDGRVPVVLIHGTWLNAYNTWDYIAHYLLEEGHAVFAVNYGKEPDTFTGKAPGVYANNYLRTSQKEVAAFIDEVLERTGAEQVDLIGHSQGVAQARLYLTDSGGHNPDEPNRNKVRKLIGIGPATRGTTLSGISTFAKKLDPTERSNSRVHSIFGGAALDQRKGAGFGEHLNRGGDTVPGVDYTMITARYDGIATPWKDQRMVAGEGATVHNYSVQEGGNILDLSGHLAMLYSPRTLDLVLEALKPSQRRLRKAVVLPMMGPVGLPGFMRRRHRR